MTPEQNVTITPDTVIRQTDSQVQADIDGEVVMMSIEKGSYYMLNEVGSRIWEIVQQPTSVADICSQIVAEFDVTAEQCEPDVIKLVDEMLKCQLVKVVETNP